MPIEFKNDTSFFGNLSEESDCLVINISLYQITCCEMRHNDNTILYTAEYTIDTTLEVPIDEHFIESLRYFRNSKKTFKFVYINYFTKLFTLCPDAFYDTENERTMLEFNAGKTFEEIILTDDISHDIKLIYAIDEKLKSTLNLIFPNHRLKHSLSVLSQLLLHSEELIKCDLLLVIHANYIEVLLKKDLKIELVNQFTAKTHEDILYYVLFILEQYKLNPTTATLNITGNFDSNSDIINTLKKYIKHVRLVTGSKHLKWKNVPGMPQHYYYTLLNRMFCE